MLWRESRLQLEVGFEEMHVWDVVCPLRDIFPILKSATFVFTTI